MTHPPMKEQTAREHAELISRLHEIHEDNKKDRARQNEEARVESVKHHSQAMKWTRWGFIVSVAAAILAAVAAWAALR